MALSREKSVVIEATQWFRNGDHPADYSEDQYGFEDGELTVFSGEYRRERGREGSVVRYYRRPDDSGTRQCERCGNVMHDHGWIDTLENGHVVCPGDWIIRGAKGEMYTCKTDTFKMQSPSY
jgi:hypothetical protein